VGGGYPGGGGAHPALNHETRNVHGEMLFPTKDWSHLLFLCQDLHEHQEDGSWLERMQRVLRFKTSFPEGEY
jgi:hypothetical protein